ncbi:MAG: hypothetical protein ACE15C_10590 [Phycisphaerae bacterium]
MKQIVIAVTAVALLAGTTAVVLSADRPATQPAGRPMLAHLAKVLNLTDQQRAQIKHIVAAARADAQKAAGKDAKKAVWKAALDKIRNDVLTDQQRARLANINRLHVVFKTLNLTDKQKAEVRDIFKAAHADAAKAADKDAKKAVWKAAFEKIHKDVLTDEQRARLEQLKAARKTRRAPTTAPAG